MSATYSVINHIISYNTKKFYLFVKFFDFKIKNLCPKIPQYIYTGYKAILLMRNGF
jgi:hypothetical protein